MRGNGAQPKRSSQNPTSPGFGGAGNEIARWKRAHMQVCKEPLMRGLRGQHGAGACDLGLRGHEGLDRQRWKRPRDSKSPGVETPAEKKVHPRSTREHLSSAP